MWQDDIAATLEKLANRPLIAANITPSALFRVIEETQPTLLIDEADTFLRGRNAMQGILNAGYDREGAYVMRVAGRAEPFTTGDARFAEGNEGRRSWAKTRLARYSVWCPKVMAGIGTLPETLADRCVVITMQRKAPADACERLRTLRSEEVRSRCAAFVRERSGEIAKAEPEIPGELNDRAADIWEPLLVIADLAGGEWPALARKAAQQLSVRQSSTEAVGHLLREVCALFTQAGRERMFSREILAGLENLSGRPWESLRKGRELSAWWLGAQLREAGMQRRTIRIEGEVGKGYALEELAEAMERWECSRAGDAGRSRGC